MTKNTKIYLLFSILIMSVFFLVKTSVLLEIQESTRVTRGIEYICFILLIPISILMIKDFIKSNKKSGFGILWLRPDFLFPNFSQTFPELRLTPIRLR